MVSNSMDMSLFKLWEIVKDNTWFLKSTPSSIPAGENQLHFDLLVMEAGEGGHAEKFIPGLSLGEQAQLLPAKKTCL